MRKIFFYMFIFSLPILFYACKEDGEQDGEIAELNCPVTPIHGENDVIIGKWKLVKTQEALTTSPISIDYSCEDIIYEFRSDNKLVITSNIDGQLEGEYGYTYTIPNTCPTCLPAPNLYIEKQPFYGVVYANILRIVFPEGTPAHSVFKQHHRVLVRIK